MTRVTLIGLSVSLLVFASAGCSKKASSVSESTLQGTTALSTYPATPRSIQATDETGRISRTALAPDGSFQLHLKRAHTYRVDVVTDQGAVPLVFPRTSGRVTKTFALKSDGAALTIGRVHFVHVTTRQPIAVKRSTTTSLIRTTSVTGGADDNCEDCTNNDDQDVACQDGAHGQGGSSAEMEGADSEAGATGDESVAEHNVPENVDGCGIDENDGETSDDNGDQQGEH